MKYYLIIFSCLDDKTIETPLGKVGETESFFFNRLLDSQLYTIQKKGSFLSMLQKSKLFQKKPVSWCESPISTNIDDAEGLSDEMTLVYFIFIY